ncbi:MAG: ATP-binding cassette domain-containing protein [Gracilibacteraceae bacterium]|jgi:oligopeptide/dipeptide ABC transporter ATP-binding protein|nr:ATP-binding cassette domain-containing protein [Gracilibacteraceae bacterium]
MKKTDDNERPLVEIIDIKKYFKTPFGLLHAVDNISLSISRGKTLGIVGESGCGKSTLGRVVLRLIPPTDGKILFNGENILDYDKKKMRLMRQKMQMIFQDPYSSLNPRKTVYEIIAEPLVVNCIFDSKRKINERVLFMMETVGLAERFINTYPHELDGGRRQRIGLARALSMNPQFIVCDEPVSALDVSIQAQILNLLMDLQDSLGLTYMFITHDLSVVKHISDEIAVLYIGQCVERAPSRELFQNPIHPYTKILLSSIPVPSLKSRSIQREVVKGEVTDPINPKPGCRFAPRCKYYKPECLSEELELKEVKPNHYVMCRLFG